MRLTRLSLLLVAVAVSAPVSTAPLTCYEEPGTMKRTCFDEKAVRVNGETRATRIYSGGTGGVRDTPYTFVKRQSEFNTGLWTAIDDSHTVLVGSTQ